jgi:hypothetical protein
MTARRPGPHNPRTVTANGLTLTIKEWADKLGCIVQIIYARLYRGVDPVAAVTQAVIESGSNLPHTHGMTGRPEYLAWVGMNQRCSDLSNLRYGGRGIKVCCGWRESFESFYRDVGPRPTETHSIDRVDNDGNYACGKCDECVSEGVIVCNCRWATIDVQARNRHNIRHLEHDGRCLPLIEWARITGIPTETIWRRVTTYGWDAAKALTTPIDVRRWRKSRG